MSKAQADQILIKSFLAREFKIKLYKIGLEDDNIIGYLKPRPVDIINAAQRQMLRELEARFEKIAINVKSSSYKNLLIALVKDIKDMVKKSEDNVPRETINKNP